jgi:site-specific recombinase XerD
MSMTTNDAVTKFLEQLAASKAANTVKLYGIGIARFCAHVRKTDPATITVDDVAGFAVAMHKDGLAAASREAYLTAVTLFVRWCVKTRVITLDAADSERLHDLTRENRTRRAPLPHPADSETIAALLNATHPERQSKGEPIPTKPAPAAGLARLRQLRDVALIHALRSSGMRVGEVVKLTRGDLDKTHRSARVTGKGNKERVVYFDETAWGAIECYLRERRDGALTRALSDLPLFARHSRTSSNRRLPLTTHQVQRIFAELCERAQLDTRATPHALRHAFATRVLDATSDLAAVQDLLGHVSPTTTRVYARVSSKRMRDAHRAAFGDK